MWCIATVAQWIRHWPPRPICDKILLHESEPGIAGSSPAGGFVELFFFSILVCNDNPYTKEQKNM